MALEREVLSRLDWHLTEMTPLHFLGYYMLKGVLFPEDRMQVRYSVACT